MWNSALDVTKWSKLLEFCNRLSGSNMSRYRGKKACVLQRRDGCRDGLQNSCLCVGSPGILRVWCKFALQLTARRYVLVSVTRRQHRVGSRYPATAGPESCHGARRVWRGFWHPGTKFYRSRACRGTMLIGATNLSPVTMLVGSTGAVSRYKLSRSQKFITVLDLS